MSRVLLLQPPNAHGLGTPFGTTAALAGSLVSNGFEVVQRDLNTSFTLGLLKGGFVAEIERLLRVRGALSADIAEALEGCTAAFSALRGLPSAIREDTFAPEQIFELRRNCVDFFNLCDALAEPLGNFDTFYGIVENRESNPWYRFYEELLPSAGADSWSEASLVGITISRFSRLSGLTLAKILRERYPNLHVVLGGDWFQNIDWEDSEDLRDLRILTSRYADSVVHMEGDTAIVSILRCLAGEGEWEEVPNLIRSTAGELQVNRPFIFERMPELPLPDYDGLPVEYYPGLSVEISRGCSWAKCTFCVHSRRPYYGDEFTNKPVYYRSLPPEEVVRRVRFLKEKYDKDRFELSCLDISAQELTGICKALIESDVRIRWNARPRINKLFTPELFHLMAEAGAENIHLFPETVSEYTAKLHDKKYDMAQIRKLADYWTLHKSELPPLVLNFFTGFPGERFEDFMETYEFIRDGEFRVQGLWGYIYTKNSPTYQDPEKFGFKLRKELRNPRSILENYQISWDPQLLAERERILAFVREHQDVIGRRSYSIGVEGSAPAAWERLFSHASGERRAGKQLPSSAPVSAVASDLD